MLQPGVTTVTGTRKERSSRRLGNLAPELGALEREPAMTRRRRAAPVAVQPVAGGSDDHRTLESVNAVVEQWLGQLEPDDDDLGAYHDGAEAVEDEQDDTSSSSLTLN
jgi:hypothetical protein